ncbi:MAG: RluA family pseudouridine synthase [Alphaproteobacteria bacterium]|nr:RluA family pseudouridine synthase [Alphaproteobacteria bacterium]
MGRDNTSTARSRSGGGPAVTVTIGPEGAGERLDRALAAALAAETPDDPPSRSRIKTLIAAGAVTENNAVISDPSRRVKPGQALTIAFPPTAEAEIAAQRLPLEIVYEDEYLIVVDKPPGLVVHPAPGNPDRTLVNALLAHCGASLSGIGGVARPGIVHRLDKDTSGLLVVAKTDAAHHGLAAQFAKHEVNRTYAAVVWGVPRPLRGEIEGAIGRSTRDRKKMAVVRGGRGKPALTRYRVMKPLAHAAASLVECQLATGRTHQIRVHLAAKGHPLIGDPVYGRPAGRRQIAPAVAALASAFPRQALDAFTLGFEHPVSGKALLFTRAYYSDINSLIDTLERM